MEYIVVAASHGILAAENKADAEAIVNEYLSGGGYSLEDIEVYRVADKISFNVSLDD